MEIVSQSGSGENFEGVIRIEEGKIRSHVDQVVRETVEQTLNGLLQAEADDLCGASGTRDRLSGSTRGPVITIVTCTPRLAKSRCKFRDCGTCRSRPRSSSVTGGGSRAWR